MYTRTSFFGGTTCHTRPCSHHRRPHALLATTRCLGARASMERAQVYSVETRLRIFHVTSKFGVCFWTLAARDDPGGAAALAGTSKSAGSNLYVTRKNGTNVRIFHVTSKFVLCFWTLAARDRAGACAGAGKARGGCFRTTGGLR